MSESWAEVIAERLAGAAPTGRVLLLGAADTGKTTLLGALAERLVRRGPVALVDADVGQSHIGPPTTVGWTLARRSADADMRESVDASDASTLPRFHASTPDARGIAFVGDVTPVGHLLQLTAALALCVEQAEQAATVVLIDTPGLVTGGAACSLWWTVQRLLRPQRIIAVQREDELEELLRGLQAGLSAIERVTAPSELRRKSPESRQQYRRRLFERYFHGAVAHRLDLDGLALRAAQRWAGDDRIGRVVGLTDGSGRDMAIGVIEGWRQEKAGAVVRAPQLDIRQVQCLTIGDARIGTSFGWS